MAQQSFNRFIGSWSSFEQSINSGHFEQMASSLVDPTRAVDTKLLDSYMKKIKNKANELSKQNISAAQKMNKMREFSERKIAELVEKSIKRRTAVLKQEREFAEMTAKEQGEYYVKQKKLLDNRKEELEKEKKITEDRLKEVEKTIKSTEITAEERKLFEKEQSELIDRREKLAEEEAENIADEKELEDLKLKNARSIAAARKKEEQDKRKKEVESIKSIAETLNEKISKEDREKLKDASKQDLKEFLEYKLGPQGIGKMIGDSIGNLAKTFDAAFSDAENILNTYQAAISTRLEGSGRQYKDITDVLKRNLTLNSVIEQKKVLENVGKMVEQGIAYDLEQRAFLATVSEEIKSTFDAFDSNLLRLIRIQREDSSYARMGLETSLSRLFNEYFLDSSYMNHTYDTVAGAILDATSQLTAEQSAEFEYTVQKWLGALYSMGASETFVQQVASGLNMLGTGNVEGLANNSMQTLFAMAANRSSTDYASLLTGGLNAQNTNELLKAMVEYLAEISGNTKSNKVVAGAYGNLFNMTLSDMRAIQNLQGDINSIFNENLSYSQMGGITNQRLTTLGDNYSMGKRISTLFNNVMFSSAQSLVEDPVSYILYKALNFIGGMGEPTVSVAPFGMGMTFKITDLMKDAMFGMSMLANITSSIGNMMSGVGNELINWTNQGEMRGSGYNLTVRSGESQSYTMTASGGDIETQSLQSGAQKAKDTSRTIKGSEEEEDEITIEALYYGLLDNTNKEGAVSAMNRNVASIGNLLSSSYSSDYQAQRVVITGWSIGDSEGAFEMPIKLGLTGKQQVKAQLDDTATSIKGSDEATLLELVLLLANVIAENNSINVNLASSSLPLKDFVMDTARPEMQKTPPGNGLSRPSVLGGGIKEFAVAQIQ